MPDQDGPDDVSRPGAGDVRVADFDDLASPGGPGDPDGSGVRRAAFDDVPFDDVPFGDEPSAEEPSAEELSGGTAGHPADRPENRRTPAPPRTVDLDAEDGPADRPGGGEAPRVASLGGRALDDGDGRRGAGRRRAQRGVRADRAPRGREVDQEATAPGAEPGNAGPGGLGSGGSGAAGSGRATGGRTRRGPAAEDRRASGGGAPSGPQDDESRAREICLRLLTDRARTVKELADALRRKEIPDDVAGRVLERFDEVGLVDDEAFAGQWVRSRHRHKGLGRRALAAELHRKGVAKDVADTALTEIDADSETHRARELVDRRLRAMPVGTKDERVSTARRLVGMLARKGYGAGTAYSVVREAIAARGAEEDELGDGPPED